MEIKKCRTCNLEKPVSDFYVNKHYSKKQNKILYNYTPECKKCTSDRSNQWRINNKVRHSENKNRYHNTEKGKEVRRKEVKKRAKAGYFTQYRRINPDKIKKYNKKRSSERSHKISPREWDDCKIYFNFRCAYCGLPVEEHFRTYRGHLQNIDLHKEHVVHDGINDLKNCVPSCNSCNSSKHVESLNNWYNQTNPIYSRERYLRIYYWIRYDCLKYIKRKSKKNR